LSVVYRLAVSGAGVALANRRYVTEELASGILFEPVMPVLRRDAGYFLIWSEDGPLTPAAEAFRDWIQQAEESRAQNA